MSNKKILILAAHPDDETLGCGGTIRRLSKEKNYIKLITFTDGENSRDENMSYNRNFLLKKICDKLGINDYVYGTFPDNKMDTIPLLDICKFIEKNVNFIPDIIFTHHKSCLNIDHQLVFRATLTAFRPQNGIKQKIYSYYVPSSTDYNPYNSFKGNIYYDITNEINDKIECLQIYDKEMRKYPHSRSYENIINLSKVAGAEVGVKNAEKFDIVRDII